MAKDAFIVISDIHARESLSEQISKKIESFIQFLTEIKNAESYDSICFIVAGDIAFSGSSSEYDSVKNFFDRLTDFGPVTISPGNHDHNFSTYEGSVRDILLRSDENFSDESVVNEIMKGQREYFDFEGVYSQEIVAYVNPLVRKYSTGSETKYGVYSLNTAWCSKIRERGGDIVFPEINFPEVLDEHDYKIAFFHHPLSWFEPNNGKSIRNSLRNSFDIVVTGHEHLSDSFKVDSSQGECFFIESVAFDDPNLDDNGFLVFDIDDGLFNVTPYFWRNGYFKKEAKVYSGSFNKSAVISSSGFSTSRAFLNDLDDLGVAFSHPEVDNLKLRDIFVYPNLNNLSEEGKKAFNKESSQGVTARHDSKVLVISGEEFSGKTSLLKRLCVDLLNDGVFCLFLNGLDVKRASRFIKPESINKYLKGQYENFIFEDISRLSCAKVLFIDDFHFIKGDAKSLSFFVGYWLKFFDKIVVSVSDVYDLGETVVNAAPIFGDDYKRFEILKLGYKLRYDLINKWNCLKPLCADSKVELVSLNDKVDVRVTKIIGRNYVPSTPFFLLTMLQSMDVMTGGLDVTTSSYGYYYQYLITSCLGQSSVKKESLDEVFNYITELAFCFYNEGEFVSVNRLNKFNDFFCHQYGVRVNSSERFALLEKAKILKRKDDYFSFNYPYVYYFFVAKYFSENIGDSGIDAIIDSLVATLEKRRSVNILLFLTHHSKDKGVLKKIVEASKEPFCESEEEVLAIKSNFFDSIIDAIPGLSYERVDSHEYRRDIAEAKDEREMNSPNGFSDDFEIEKLSDSSEEITGNEVNSFVKEFNRTFKSLELLGQLSRNYYGSLKAESKKELISNAISAPLRALRAIFEVLEEDSDYVVNIIKHNLPDYVKGDRSESDINSLSREILFGMVFHLTISFIRKISSSIGSEDVLNIIEDICVGRDDNVSRLLLISVNFELGKRVPSPMLKEYRNKLGSSYLSTMVLKSLVLNYLHMFEVPDRDAQALCDTVGISYQGRANLRKKLQKS